MIKPLWLAALLLLLALAGRDHLALDARTGWALPDPRLTPGAVASTDLDEICAPGYDRAHRVWPYPEGKRNTAARYGIPWSEAHRYQDDDLIPVGVGGDNGDANNHWMQPCAAWEGSRCVAGQAAIKDRIEMEMRRKVCSGEITPERAQEYFRTNGWAK